MLQFPLAHLQLVGDTPVAACLAKTDLSGYFPGRRITENLDQHLPAVLHDGHVWFVQVGAWFRHRHMSFVGYPRPYRRGQALRGISGNASRNAARTARGSRAMAGLISTCNHNAQAAPPPCTVTRSYACHS